MEEPIRRFLDEISWSDYAHAQYAVLARRRLDGLFPVQAIVMLTPREPEPGWTVKSESADLLVDRGSIPAEDLRAALEQPQVTKLPLGSNTLELRRVEAGQSASWNYFPGHDWGVRRIGWPARVLRVGLSGIPEVLAPLEWSSIDEDFGKLAPYPFPSLPGTVRWLSPALDLAGHSCLDVYAPVFARIHDVELSLMTGEVAAVVDTWLDPKAVPMSVLFAPHESQSPPVTVPCASWTPVDHCRWRARTVLPAGTGWADVRLIARGLSVWSESTYAPSVMVQAHSRLSGGTEWLARLLRAESTSKNRARDFERGIVALLALAKIPGVPYGHDGLDRYSDFIAYTSDDHLLVGECTIETPSPDKMAKLRGRTEELGSGLAIRGRIPLTHSVVFLPTSFRVMPQELQDKASELRVTLIWGEKLEQLVTHIEAGDASERIFEMIRHASL